MRPIALVSAFALTLALAACGSPSDRAPELAIGPNPPLPEPKKTLIPTVNVAEAKGWPDGAMPTAAAGLKVNEFGGGLEHPRWLHVLPNGDVLVAETESPGTDKTGGAIKGTIQKMMMKKAGSGKKPSANRITLLRDADGDGSPNIRRRSSPGSIRRSAWLMPTTNSTSPMPTAWSLIPIRWARPRSAAHRATSPPCRRAIITTGRNRWSPRPTAASCSSAWDQTATSARMA